MNNNEIKLMLGDCLDRLKDLPDNSVDSIVTDPPYGISFMAKKWDYDVPSVDVWNEAMRVLKPGGHALIACGTRTQHRMVVNIEDAGFEIRDVVSWIYGSGFPKSLNISKAIDKRGGLNVSWFGEWLRKWRQDNSIKQKEIAKLFPSKTGNITGCVANWELGLNLPTCEQFNTIIQAFNLPFKDIYEAEREVVGTQHRAAGNDVNVPISAACGNKNGGWFDITAPATESAKQWDGWGTALKPACEFFTLCRKPLSEKTIAANVLKWGTGGINVDGCRVGTDVNQTNTGRFPANLIHDGSQEVLELFPETKSGSRKGGIYHDKNQKGSSFKPSRTGTLKALNGDQGSAARFFYAAKASKKDREEGNTHPTVKPTNLMAYLCRLITPTGGTVLDPYMGSGSTGKAARREGFRFVGIEREPEYMAIAEARITNAI